MENLTEEPGPDLTHSGYFLIVVSSISYLESCIPQGRWEGREGYFGKRLTGR